MPLLASAACAFAITATITEPLGRAFGLLFATILLLPFAADDLGDESNASPQRPTPRLVDYLVAIAPLIITTALTSQLIAALLVFAVAASMIGLVALLAAIRIPTRFGCALVILQSVLLLSWPVWAAQLLLHINTDRWLQYLINVSPTFALNATIVPTDPFTHRPLMYRLANLGQDINYAMPASAWPSIGLHLAVAFFGGLCWLLLRKQPRRAPAVPQTTE